MSASGKPVTWNIDPINIRHGSSKMRTMPTLGDTVLKGRVLECKGMIIFGVGPPNDFLRALTNIGWPEKNTS